MVGDLQAQLDAADLPELRALQALVDALVVQGERAAHDGRDWRASLRFVAQRSMVLRLAPEVAPEVVACPVPAGAAAPAVEPPAAASGALPPGAVAVPVVAPEPEPEVSPLPEPVPEPAPAEPSAVSPWPDTPLGVHLAGLDRGLWPVEADRAVVEARVLRLPPDELRATLAEIDGRVSKRLFQEARARLQLLTGNGAWPPERVLEVLTAALAGGEE